MRTVIRMAFAAAILSIATSSVLAHMKATKTSPSDGESLGKPPEFVQVWFSQKPDEAISRVTLTGPSGEVSLFVHGADGNSLMGMIQEKRLADGAYVVKWQAAGDDGHIQKGEYKFSVSASK